MASNEETPLLEPPAESLLPKHELVYQRFSQATKRTLVTMVSFCGLIAFFVSGTFIPCIPQIAKDLDSDGPTVSLAVSLSIFATSLGALFGSSYSTFYGRKPIYLCGLPLLAIGSFGVASARSITELMIWRFIQAFGASPGLSVGAGVIGDIYKLDERGQAMGVFFAAILLGPALAPLAGGMAAHYSSWRVMQAGLGFTGVILFIVILILFPETSHPGARGVDKLELNKHPKWRPVVLNPFNALWLLRSPNLLAVSLSGFAMLLSDYVLLVPLAYTIGVRYNISNEALIGACFLPAGVGNMIGAPLAGRISDRIVVRWREKRGVWYPEDRLRATLSGALIFVPCSVLFSGLLTHYVGGTLGLILNLICLFFNGLGVDIVLSPSAAYIVDVMHSRSAESMAANSAFRSILISICVAGVVPMIDTYGILFTNTVCALISWLGFGLLWLTIRYGEGMRGWVNVGFSTEENN